MTAATTAAPLKKLYDLRQEGDNLLFVRRGVSYNLEISDPALSRALPYLQTSIPLDRIAKVTGVPQATLKDIGAQLGDEDLLDVPESGPVAGKEFYRRFRETLPDWLHEAFSAPYWEVMLSGKGSRELYIGYLLELYHYTRNANRHMPLVVATCPPEWKELKRLLATHYFEEWNHYDFFADALEAMGVSRREVEQSDPLPSTLEMSNFMRQAARTSTLCYAICSAILEGTTEDNQSFGDYFSAIGRLYEIPEAAIKPLFDHLALDAGYDHKSLFGQICEAAPELPREEAERAMSFGRQMIDHIYLWTDHIHRYYASARRGPVRRVFDLNRD